MAANKKKRFGVFENGPSSKKRESLIFFYVLNVLTTHTQNDWIVGRRAVNRPTNMAERLAPKRQLLYISSESDECKATFAWTLLPLQCLFVSIRSFCAYLMPSHWQWQLSNHLSACLAVALKNVGWSMSSGGQPRGNAPTASPIFQSFVVSFYFYTHLVAQRRKKVDMTGIVVLLLSDRNAPRIHELFSLPVGSKIENLSSFIW